MERAAALARITSTTGICGGRPCIAGTRIPVEIVLENLSEGVSHSELLQAYPSLREEDITAALVFAAELSRMSVEPLPADETAQG